MESLSLKKCEENNILKENLEENDKDLNKSNEQKEELDNFNIEDRPNEKIQNDKQETSVLEDQNNCSLDSEKEIISKLMRKAQSTKSSPNANFWESKMKNKIFGRFAISPVMQPIKNNKLIQSKNFYFLNLFYKFY